MVLQEEYFGELGVREDLYFRFQGVSNRNPPSEDGGDTKECFSFAKAGGNPRPTKVGGSLARHRAEGLLSRGAWGLAGKRFAVPAGGWAGRRVAVPAWIRGEGGSLGGVA